MENFPKVEELVDLEKGEKRVRQMLGDERFNGVMESGDKDRIVRLQKWIESEAKMIAHHKLKRLKASTRLNS